LSVCQLRRLRLRRDEEKSGAYGETSEFCISLPPFLISEHRAGGDRRRWLTCAVVSLRVSPLQSRPTSLGSPRATSFPDLPRMLWIHVFGSHLVHAVVDGGRRIGFHRARRLRSPTSPDPSSQVFSSDSNLVSIYHIYATLPLPLSSE